MCFWNYKVLWLGEPILSGAFYNQHITKHVNFEIIVFWLYQREKHGATEGVFLFVFRPGMRCQVCPCAPKPQKPGRQHTLRYLTHTLTRRIIEWIPDSLILDVFVLLWYFKTFFAYMQVFGIIIQSCLHAYASPSPAVLLADESQTLRALQVLHFLPKWWCISCLSLAPWETFCTVVHSVYVSVCVSVHMMHSYMCVCACVSMCVRVCWVFREDLFPQQALSGCFWAHSVHSWRLLLSPAYLTSLLSYFLFSLYLYFL